MILNIGIIIFATLGIWLFSMILSNGTDQVGKRFGIDPGVRGATLDAVSSSFPEFCTVISALIAGAFEAGVGAVAGSALYNILVIPALSVVIGGNLSVRKEIVRRDGFIYAAVVVLLILAIWLGPQSLEDEQIFHLLPWWIGLLAILIYIGYVVLLVVCGKDSQSEAKPAGQIDFKPLPLKVPVSILAGIIGIGVATHFLVIASLSLFKGLGFSEAITGVTILAAATSLPDTLLSIFSIRRGDPDGAVSNAFGSNSFDILICLGLPILVMWGVKLNWSDSWPILIFSLGSTLVRVTFLTTDWTLSKREAAFMGGLYIVFNILAFTGVL